MTTDVQLVEVADRCWTARHGEREVTACVIGGARGLVLVDTLGSVGRCSMPTRWPPRPCRPRWTW